MSGVVLNNEEDVKEILLFLLFTKSRMIFCSVYYLLLDALTEASFCYYLFIDYPRLEENFLQCAPNDLLRIIKSLFPYQNTKNLPRPSAIYTQ